MELGGLLAPEFPDGVAFIPFADISEPEDFVPALAEALDVKEAEGRTLGEGLVTLIGDRKALLLLDNLEQIVAAAPEVAALIERCPGLRIVTTSRTPLRIAAEREYALAPLEAVSWPVELFVERARAAKRVVRAHSREQRGRHRGLSNASTACLSRSSWPPRDYGCCRRKGSSSGSTARSTS